MGRAPIKYDVKMSYLWRGSCSAKERKKERDCLDSGNIFISLEDIVNTGHLVFRTLRRLWVENFIKKSISAKDIFLRDPKIIKPSCFLLTISFLVLLSGTRLIKSFSEKEMKFLTRISKNSTTWDKSKERMLVDLNLGSLFCISTAAFATGCYCPWFCTRLSNFSNFFYSKNSCIQHALNRKCLNLNNPSEDVIVKLEKCLCIKRQMIHYPPFHLRHVIIQGIRGSKSLIFSDSAFVSRQSRTTWYK